ncbi:MAG: low molecular weight phosphotyrosine protein phosphatase [Bacteroidia bacterium]|nr:low molecular weight phosphotyrosine protein phosphatase [Bacteroidia bacterium]
MLDILTAEIQKEAMIKVLFVCLGNICRSPAAEGLMRKHIDEAGLSGKILVESAGTSGWHVGDLPDPRMREAALRHGVILDTRAREFRAEDLSTFDYIIAMDRQNERDILALVPTGTTPHAWVQLMRSYDQEEKADDVPDPYFGGKHGFEQVYHMLNRCTKVFFDAIKETHGL